MRWPWSKPERRESAPYTDAVVAALTAQASGQAVGDASAIAALESACALYANAFGAARVTPAEARTVLTPRTLRLIARNLLRRGEDLHQITIEGGELRLAPIGSWDVRGGPDERAWWYRCDRFGPSGNLTQLVPSAAVVHCRYSVGSARPWYGISAIGWARATATLAANLETRLGEEAGSPVGSVLPYPVGPNDPDDEDDPTSALRRDIAAAKGRPLIVETTSAGGGEGRAAAPASDWIFRRYGASPPEVLGNLRTDAGMSVLSACGVPVSLVTDADGTSQRESWRRFIMGSVEPLLAIVAQEIETKLEIRVAFDLSPLWAHDLAGRAASFKAMVTGGMDVAKAAALAGLMADEAA